MLGPDGHPYPVELWARVPAISDGRTHLVGAVLDARTLTAAAAAVERLRDGVFSLDPDGRISYANRSAEPLLQARREDLVGHHPWHALSWLADPFYENRYRAALLSQQPTAFLALRPPGSWLAFSLYPDAHGVTGQVVAAGPPPGTAEPPATVPPGVRSDLPTGVGGTYHLLQLASALTEAVSVRDVCRVVAEEILPAFGGQELAIYGVRDKHLHLVSQSGYPEGFLDRFEGTPVGARIPGAETLSTGTPIFFESVQELAAAYPDIALDEMGAWAFLPLIASGHPVGSCILGFDRPRPFTAEDAACSPRSAASSPRRWSGPGCTTPSSPWPAACSTRCCRTGSRTCPVSGSPPATCPAPRAWRSAATGTTRSSPAGTSPW